MSNGRLLGKLLGSSGSVPTEKLAGNITIEKLAGDIPITEKFTTASLLPATGIIGEQAFVEETNRLYIWNGSGWYNIALINTTPTWASGGQPAGSYILDADSPQDAIVITLAASDPEGLPINYSYVTSGSMDSMATISQDSSVFTITPKTEVQAPDGGTGTITFRASDGVNQSVASSDFSLTFAPPAAGVLFTTTGTHSWTVPTGVTSVSVVCIGGGGSGGGNGGQGGGTGGGLGYKNNISVTPGSSITVVVGEGGSQFGNAGNNGGDSYFQSTSVCKGGGGLKKSASASDILGGTYTGDGGGNGGPAYAGYSSTSTHGGSGAGGYTGTGGYSQGSNGTSSSGGGGGAGGGGGGGSSQTATNAWPYYGGGTGVYGQGRSGYGSGAGPGQFGSGGSGTNVNAVGNGESYGGASGSSGGPFRLAAGNGAVRIVWGGSNRAFPSTNVGYADSTDGETTV
tara:strand:+ start:11180 stop:12547 length:1368 start_codon:yes stop_codon:yes gene_type:complete